MRTVYLSVLLCLAPASAASSLKWHWLLNHELSSFGSGTQPDRLIVRLEETAGCMAILKITSDAEGDHLDYRKFSHVGAPGEAPAVAFWKRGALVVRSTTPQGERVMETWRLRRARRLLIDREVVSGSGMLMQRLVLEPTDTYSRKK